MTMIRNHVVVTDSGTGGTGKYRGAQVWSLTANTLTCMVRLEGNINGQRSFPRSFAPSAIVSDALALEVSGSGAEDYMVVSAHPATFGGVTGGETSVARGEFVPGVIPDHLSGEKPYRPWWSGMLHERSARYWDW